MRIARGLMGVIIGFGVFLAIVRIPSANLLLSLAATVAAGVLAGYITAWIAGAHEFPHAAAVGLLIIGMSFLSMRAQGASRPDWYQTAIAGCGPVSVMIGAAIRLLTKLRAANRR